MSQTYQDADGNPCTLDALCIREPAWAASRILAQAAEIERLEGCLWTPEVDDFVQGVLCEAQHQRARWGTEHDAGKEPQDWYWLLGYLGGKALRASLEDDQEKALHHCISSAAALANWHAQLSKAHESRKA